MARLGVVLLLTLVLPLVGCSNYAARNYSPSAEHVAHLRQASEGPRVHLGAFENGEGVLEESMCRMAGEIELPGTQDWAGYVREALKAELVMAKRYAPEESAKALRIQGVLEKATFDSAAGTWDLALRLVFPDGTTVQESVRYAFDSSFIATDACRGVANAFAPAVRKLVGAVIRNPTFRERLARE